MSRRFALIAEHRTGSTWLMNALNSHPDILCDNELFNHGAVVHYRPLGPNETDRAGLTARNADPLGFLEAFHARHEGAAAAVGFNFMLGHDARVLMALLDGGTDLLVLGRANRMAQYASFRRGEATQAWAARNPEVAARQKRESLGSVTFRIPEFERWMQRQITLRALLDRLLEARPAGRCLKLDYADVVAGRESARICAFLGVPARPLVSDLRKQGADDVLARFSNPEAARAYLEAIGRPDWVRETIA